MEEGERRCKIQRRKEGGKELLAANGGGPQFGRRELGLAATCQWTPQRRHHREAAAPAAPVATSSLELLIFSDSDSLDGSASGKLNNVRVGCTGSTVALLAV